jgi:N-formylglutamate deformylase
MDAAHFAIIEPGRDVAETPIVVEVPHAGVAVPMFARATLAADETTLHRDADLFVDELYAEAPLEGATLLVAKTSRCIVDLNRSESDLDADAVVGAKAGVTAPHGVVWMQASDGSRVLSRPLTKIEFEERLDRIHRPYHAALRSLLDRKKEKFGCAIVLAAHSMPSVGRAGSADDRNRADVVPGTRGRTSAAPRFIDAVDAHASARGWSVRHDEPYRGGFTTQFYGRPPSGIHVIQIELARRLYMNEDLLAPKPKEFAATRAWCGSLVGRLAKLALR